MGLNTFFFYVIFVDNLLYRALSYRSKINIYLIEQINVKIYHNSVNSLILNILLNYYVTISKR